MHELMLNEVVGVCRQREREGDCPTVKAFGVEALEDAVIELANARDAAAAKSITTLATAVHKFAPDLAFEIARRWKARSEREDAALDEFLAVMRNAPAPSAGGETK